MSETQGNATATDRPANSGPSMDLRSLIPSSRVTSTIAERTAQFVVSFAFFSAYSIYVTLIYMAENGFFAYDVFSAGSFGMTVFTVTTEIQVMIGALAAFGGIGFFPSFRRMVGYQAPAGRTIHDVWARFSFWGYRIGAFVFNVAMLALIVWHLIGHYAIEAIVLLSILFFVASHLLFLVMADTRKIWRSLSALCFILVGMSIPGKEVIASLFALGLKTYGVGGGIEVVIKQPGPTEVRGNLILLAPENVYVRVDDPKNKEAMTAVIPRSAILGTYVTTAKPKAD